MSYIRNKLQSGSFPIPALSMLVCSRLARRWKCCNSSASLRQWKEFTKDIRWIWAWVNIKVNRKEASRRNSERALYLNGVSNGSIFLVMWWWFKETLCWMDTSAAALVVTNFKTLGPRGYRTKTSISFFFSWISEACQRMIYDEKPRLKTKDESNSESEQSHADNCTCYCLNQTKINLEQKCFSLEIASLKILCSKYTTLWGTKPPRYEEQSHHSSLALPLRPLTSTEDIRKILTPLMLP